MQALYAQMQAQVQQSLSAAAQNGAVSGSRAGAGRDLPRIRQPSQFVGAMGFGVDDWIGEMLQQFAYYGDRFPDDSARIRFAVAFLAGPAMHWWEHEADRATLADWSEFVRRLHARFRPVQAAMLARQRLGKLTQRAGQSVNQYTSAFQVTLTPIVDMGDADQVHHYVNGLLGSVAAKVWERHPTTLKQAIDFAVSVEAMSNYGRAAMAPTSSSYRPSYVGGSSQHHTSAPMEVNHIEDEPVAMGGSDYSLPGAQPMLDPVVVMLAKMESMEQRLNAIHQSGAGLSFGGGRRDQGHDRSRIPDLKPGEIGRLQKDGRCFRCKQKGHMKNECPQRPKNE
jgi:hypothetical protein